MAEELLASVLEAHGGQDRWEQAEEIRFRARCGGLALAARWQKNAYRQYTARVSVQAPRVCFDPFKGRRGWFTPEKVWIEASDGEILKSRTNPRSFFPGGRRALVWDALDILYFGGYAIWNYICTPFLLAYPDTRLARGADWQEGGEAWQRLVVRFPDTLPTHCREQIFYIDDQGRIRRHDYTAEVIGGYARAAQYCDRHRRYDGILFPTRRRILPRRRNNRPASFPTLVWIDIDHIELH
ncbi:MAG: hypothetical protein QNJ02_12205 [Desulfobacterales bacterium]|nr:hypothetical protein [Desulfobacterales bacterium]